MDDPLVDLINDIQNNGIRWGIIFTLYAVYRKESRNSRLDKRDADIFHNQLILMKALGVDSQWRGQVIPFQSQEVENLKRLLQSSQGALKRVHQKRRVIKMNQVNWTTLVPGLISTAKLVLQSFGIDIPDEHINAIVNGAAAVGAIIAIFLSHKRGVTSNVSTQLTNTFESNK